MATRRQRDWDDLDDPRRDERRGFVESVPLNVLAVNAPNHDELLHDESHGQRNHNQSPTVTTSDYDHPIQNDRGATEGPDGLRPSAQQPNASSRSPSRANSNHSNAGALKLSGSLRRKLDKEHIFMIAISAVIGMGFYVRTGAVYHLGGSAAVIYSFAFLGLLTSAVVHNLSNMLSAWPIPGALIVFVQSFVDEEVGMTVGILYWLTYIFSFAALTSTLGRLADSVLANDQEQLNKGISALVSILSLLFPILFNLTEAQTFRKIELFFGYFKIFLAVFIIILMNYLNPSAGTYQQSQLPHQQQRDVAFIDNGSYAGWFGVIMTSIYVTSFSYVGVESVAATAQEAKLDSTGESTDTDTDHEATTHNESNGEEPPLNTGTPGQRNALPTLTVRLSDAAGANTDNQSDNTTTQSDKTTGSVKVYQHLAVLVPLVAAFIYLWGGWSATQDIDYQDPELPSLLWNSTNGTSIFVAVAINHSGGNQTGDPPLAKALTALLIINVFSTSSTALYIASRTLYGMAYAIQQDEDLSDLWRVKVARVLAHKNKFDVPWVSVLVSAWLFWLPFIRYDPEAKLNIAIDIIAEMGSVSCILVWAFESVAAFRLYGRYNEHFDALDLGRVAHGRNAIFRVKNRSWYRFHRFSSLAAAICCFLIVFLGGGMIYKNNRDDPLQGVAAFSIIGAFIGITAILKVVRRGFKKHKLWSWDTLYKSLDSGNLKKVLKDLHNNDQHRKETFDSAMMPEMWDLAGVFWFRKALGDFFAKIAMKVGQLVAGRQN